MGKLLRGNRLITWQQKEVIKYCEIQFIFAIQEQNVRY
jgi:hypothetical protein